MTHYIYPQNLKATANMWLWSLRDFAIMGVAALISIVILVELHLMLPAAATLCPLHRIYPDGTAALSERAGRE